MSVEKARRLTYVSWLFVCALVILSAVLGVLQYRWIGEVSRAEHDRLQASLQTSLNRISQDFNAELSSACAAVVPERLPFAERTEQTEAAREEEYATRYLQWRETSKHHELFRGMWIVIPEGTKVSLRALNPETESFEPVAWPAEWAAQRDRIVARLATNDAPGEMRRPPGWLTADSSDLIDLPLPGRHRVEDHPFRRETGWVLLQLNLDYVRTAMIPDLLRRDFGPNGTNEYQAEVVLRDNPSKIIYESTGGQVQPIGMNSDASANLFDVRMDMIFRRSGFLRPSRPGEPAANWRSRPRRAGAPPEMTNPNRGRWQLLARHRAGSLEALVARTRSRNLAVTAGILLLMMGAVVALVQFTRRSQRLAELQMEFVAGVSHELRTPLSVMRTAGHNLQGKVSGDATRVQRYGALIQEESEKLAAIVEQVLSFSNAKMGRVVGAMELVSVESLLNEAIEADRRLIEQSHCTIEKKIEPQLPPVLADPATLKHALQNLVSNAAKYGRGGDWIGISALLESSGDNGSTVQIRVSDRGAGIPKEEIAHIFDPFYRGKKAITDQIHGTGLGLSLAKRIIEAHHGSIGVQSETGKGTEFLVRIPAAPLPQTNEFANSAG